MSGAQPGFYIGATEAIEAPKIPRGWGLANAFLAYLRPTEHFW